MNKLLKIVMVLLLLWIIIAVFVSPAVDLQPTAMRAARFAILMFAIVGLVAAQIFQRMLSCDWMAIAIPLRFFLFSAAPDLIDLDCVRLC